MPQDGSNNYQYPPGTPGIPDQTIESEAYNTFLDDLVVNDLNIARPVHRGGTGATNAFDARDNLEVERADAEVTNYDSHLFENGSFRSPPAATNSPVAGHAFSGFCHIYNPLPTGYMILEVRDYNDNGRPYVRKMDAGVWGPWVIGANSQADADGRYVNIPGDTMSGALNITFSSPTIYEFLTLSNIATQACGIRMNTNGHVAQMYCTTVGELVLRVDGQNVATLGPGGDFYVNNGKLVLQNQGFDVNGTSTISWNSGSWEGLSMNNPAANCGIAMIGGGRTSGIYGRNGGGLLFRADGAEVAHMDPGGGFAIIGQAFKPGGGDWVDGSDARIKTVLGDYTSGLDAVAALEPVRFVFKGNETDEPPTNIPLGQEDKEDPTKDAATVPYPNSPHYTQAQNGTEFIGLLAQNAELTMPEMVRQKSGYIDGQAVTDLRLLDTTSLIFALINAVKELKARVEALESA